EDRPRPHAGDGAADEVQIGAADRARGEAHDCVVRVLDLRLGDVVQADVADAVEDDGFHVSLLLTSMRRPRSRSFAAPAGIVTSRTPSLKCASMRSGSTPRGRLTRRWKLP